MQWNPFRRRVAFALLAVAAAWVSPNSAAAPDPQSLYATHCASCHGPDRLGGMGPALLPENLERLKRADAIAVIAKGRVATQMPAFDGRLSTEEIDALAALVYAKVEPPPRWGEAEIASSRIELVKPGSLPDSPQFVADPMNLFVVVEAGDHHVTILDGDRFEPLTRVPTRYALHGGPKFTPDGRHVFFCSRDGWVTKFDLWNLKTVAEVRAGINARNLAVSGDGRYVMVANYLPRTLVVLDARDLSLVKLLEVKDRTGRSSRVSAVYDAAPRRSFVAALKDVPEIWEISYDDAAAPIHDGLVHDYKLGEGIAIPGKLNPRRTPLEDVLDDLFFDPSYAYVIGASREGGKGQVVNLDVRRKIADVPLPGLPHLGSGISWSHDGARVMATPNLKQGIVSVIDMKTWTVVKEIPTLGPGFFMRSHEATPYAWVDAMMSPDKDTMQLIDKRTLEVAKTLRPEPGKTAAHVEFTRDGRYALVSIWEQEGALVIYDSATLKEVRRLPMKKPVGKYNVWNKIMRSEGTSH
jgi:mono/diheme cytochrome c family protein/DNA-binding beta-propeller fold protein YncE